MMSIFLSFVLGSIIVFTFVLVDHVSYKEHRLFYMFLLSTFVLLFESYLFWLDVKLFWNVRLSDLNMLMWPLYLFPYYRWSTRTLYAIFYSFFTYLSVEGIDMFLRIITSSVVGDEFVLTYSTSYNIVIRILSFLIILKLLKSFDFDFSLFYQKRFRQYIWKLNFIYFTLFIFINFALWVSEQPQFKNFGSMVATICILTFIGSLFHMLTVRDRYQKMMELRQKKFAERQMSRYMSEIQSLYSTVRGFRHDFGNLVLSMSLAIENQDISEISRIHEEVLSKAYKEINKEELTGFDLANIGDSALRSILIRGWLDAKEYGIHMVFETEEFIKKVPMDLLDLVRVVGILVNNAIEAAKDTVEKEVHIAVFSMNKTLFLVIHNSADGDKLDMKQIYEEGYSTKGKGRGFGLSNVREIIDHYESIYLETELKENVFSQVLKIGG